MTAGTVLRLSVVGKWLLILVAVAASLTLESSLHPLLQDYLALQAEQVFSYSELLVFGIMLVFALLSLAASVGLLFLRNWARWLSLVCVACMYPAAAYLGPVVDHGVASTIGDLAVLLDGLILGIAFFGGVIPTSSPRVTDSEANNW